MPIFKFTELVYSPLPEIHSTCLGIGGVDVFDSLYDLGKPVVLGPNNNFIRATAGQDIEAIVESVEAGPTYNSGYYFGTVRKNGRVTAVVGPNQGGTHMAVRDLVVCDVNPGTGVVLPNAAPIVKTGTPTLVRWRVIALGALSGAIGDTVLLEKV